jgi:hypothetical protein
MLDAINHLGVNFLMKEEAPFPNTWMVLEVGGKLVMSHKKNCWRGPIGVQEQLASLHWLSHTTEQTNSKED